MNLSPKTKRNISRIVPFALIWWLSGWVFILTDLGLTRNQNLNPETDIAFTIPVLIFANIANIIVGSIVGTLEVIYLERRFTNYSLRGKLFYKFIVYLALFLILIFLFFPIAFSLETGIGIFTNEAWNKLLRFLGSLTFINTLFQLSILMAQVFTYLFRHK